MKTVDVSIKKLISNNLISKGLRTSWNGANSSNMYFVNDLLERDGNTVALPYVVTTL